MKFFVKIDFVKDRILVLETNESRKAFPVSASENGKCFIHDQDNQPQGYVTLVSSTHNTPKLESSAVYLSYHAH